MKNDCRHADIRVICVSFTADAVRHNEVGMKNNE